MPVTTTNHTNAAIIVAEAGVNHNGSLALALQLVEAAAASGADFVKFQTFKTEALVAQQAKKADYQKRNTDGNESQFDMLRRLELTPTDHEALQQHCRKCNIGFLSTAFDLESLRFLIQEQKLRSIKISSGDLVSAPLLVAAAAYNVSIILSTGMATLAEIEDALSALAFGYLYGAASPTLAKLRATYHLPQAKQILRERVTLLQCTTEYPAPFSDVNLRAMDTLAEHFGLAVGFSDHTVGIEAAVAAVARGASMIEKHLTLDQNLPGPDHKASLEPKDFAAMVRAIRNVEAALGNGRKVPQPSELANIVVARKSLAAIRPITKGQIFTPENLGFMRPGNGASPFLYWDLLGKQSPKDFAVGDVIDII